jgi:hypothetical protein
MVVRNPSRFSGSTGLRQNIVKNAAPKLPSTTTPPTVNVTDYADPYVEPSQAFLEADGFADDTDSTNTQSVPPRDRPGYDELVGGARDDLHFNKDGSWTGSLEGNSTGTEDDVVDYRDNNRRGGLTGLWNSGGSTSTSGTGSIFHDIANIWTPEEHKHVLNPNWEKGDPSSDKFTTKYILASQKADALALEDQILADKVEKENALHSNFSTFYVGGQKEVNPNQVKFDELRKDTLTKDNKATGVMQNVDGKEVFQTWGQVAKNYGPNVKVNYGLYGDPMTPTPGKGPSGVMTISRSMSEQSHAGIQSAINKQQVNRDFNLTLKTWQSEYLLGSRDDAAKTKAKSFIEEQKKKYLEWGNQGGHGIGGYGEMFGKELDRRYYNLFESPSSPGQQNKYPGRKLTVAEKIKKKIDNGTATAAEIKKYAILTRAPGNISGVDLFTGSKSNVDPTMGYSNFLGNDSLY